MKITNGDSVYIVVSSGTAESTLGLTYSAMSTRACFVQSPQSESADMASLVIAWCNRDVVDGAGTDEANLSLICHLLASICVGGESF